jgi:hypothetical protein
VHRSCLWPLGVRAVNSYLTAPWFHGRQKCRRLEEPGETNGHRVQSQSEGISMKVCLFFRVVDTMRVLIAAASAILIAVGCSQANVHTPPPPSPPASSLPPSPEITPSLVATATEAFTETPSPTPVPTLPACPDGALLFLESADRFFEPEVNYYRLEAGSLECD